MTNLEQWLRERLRDARTDDPVDADRLWNRLETELPTSVPPTEARAAKLGYGLLLIFAVAAVIALAYGTKEVTTAATGENDVVEDATQRLKENGVVDRSMTNYPTKSGEEPPATPKSPAAADRSFLQSSGSASGSGKAYKSGVSTTSSRPETGAQPVRALVEESQPHYPATTVDPLRLSAISALPTVPLWKRRTVELGEGPQDDRSFVRAGMSSWVLTLRSGPTLSFPGFGNYSSDELGGRLAAASGPVLGHGSEVQLQYQLSPGWSVGFGVGLDKAVNAFRYQYSYDTVAVIDGREGPALATRRITHNNRLLAVTLPLSLEWRRSLGRVEWGISAGAAFHVALRQSGRTIGRDAQVHTYDGASDPAAVPLSGSWFSLRLLPFLRYRLDDKTALEIAPSVTYHRYGTSPLWQLETSALSAGLRLGIRRGW